MYTRKLKLLLRALRISGQSGVVSIEPLQSVPEPWIAHFQLLKGAVGLCQVQRQKDGQVFLSNREALQWLEHEEELSWNLVESSQPTLPPHFISPTARLHQHGIAYQSPESTSGLGRAMPSRGDPPMYMEPVMPRRTNGNRLSTVSWPRGYRQVFALVDGHRTREDIALLLHWPSERVTSVLDELQSKGLIEL